jgi:hypothetical protein
MNRNQFYQYLDNFNNLNDESLTHLKELVTEYPFFQTARMLMVKNMHLLDHIKYQNELKLVATHISDRKQLYRLIHNSLQQAEKPFKVNDEQQSNDIDLNNFSSRLTNNKIDNENYFNVTDRVETTKEIIDFSSKKYNTGKQRPEVEVPQNDFLDFELNTFNRYQLSDEPIDPAKSRSFVDWLSAMNQSQHQPATDTNPNAPVQHQMNLIDSFLKKGKDKITPAEIKPIEPVDISANSIIEKDELMTETLANIHIKQKRYDKAILIFEKLSLKYPEKNIYFATRINELEKLISNQ